MSKIAKGSVKREYSKRVLSCRFSSQRSNFAAKGADCAVLPDLQKLIEDFYCEKKPIGSMCIASAVVAKVLNGVKVTLGKECESPTITPR